MTAAVRAAVDWLRDHGGDCAVATTKAGGRIFLAQGEQAPFSVVTAKRMIDDGHAEYVAAGGRPKARLRLTGGVQ